MKMMTLHFLEFSRKCGVIIAKGPGRTVTFPIEPASQATGIKMPLFQYWIKHSEKPYNLFMCHERPT